MKKIMISMVVITLAACSSGSKEENTIDSTAADDTVTETIAPAGESTVTTLEVVTGDTSQLLTRFDEISEANEAHSDQYLTVTITTQQYEASSDVTWYFDDTFAPRYFKMSWAAEGNEGYTEYFIEKNEVLCAREEDNNLTKKWCTTTGGTVTTWNKNEDTNTITLVEADFGNDCNESLERYMSSLTAILKEGEITEKDENLYTIRIEKTVDVGTEVKESTEVKIPRKLYDSIMGE